MRSLRVGKEGLRILGSERRTGGEHEGGLRLLFFAVDDSAGTIACSTGTPLGHFSWL